MSDPTAHQSFQGFPKLDSMVVDPSTGALSLPWYRLLISLWQKLGGSLGATPSASFLQTNGSSLLAFNSMTGKQIGPGPLSFGQIGGNAQQTVPLGSSPATITAGSAGQLVVSGGGKVELARPPSTFVVVSLVGGAVGVLEGDEVKISWFQGPAPVATFFPTIIS